MNNAVVSADTFIVNNEIFIGDWCVFYSNTHENSDEENFKVLIGLVLGFSYTDGKTFKEREYSKLYAPVTSDVALGTRKVIGMSCATYTYTVSGKLISVPGDKHEFIDVESYIGTIQTPAYTSKVLTVSEKLITKLRDITDLH